jgi:hypothetical protein
VLEYGEAGGIGIGWPGYTDDESLNVEGCKGWFADLFGLDCKYVGESAENLRLRRSSTAEYCWYPLPS